MEGTIYSIRKNQIGLFGFIAGQDGVKYYFDQRSVAKGFNISSFSSGNLVSFSIKNAMSSDRCPIAYDLHPSSGAVFKQTDTVVLSQAPSENGKNTLSIQSEEAEDDDGIIKFFKPGYARRLDIAKAKHDHYKEGSGEAEVTDKLSQIFYVSRIEHHAFHSAQYPFCLVGATRPFSQFIRGKYEFLLIFSHFDNSDWQATTLLADREIRKRNEIADRRPLVNFYILISNARQLKKEINKVRGSTSAAVIPFSFEEILGCSDRFELIGLVQKRFSNYLFENNMLGDTAVIDDDNLLFGDRGKIADAIVQRCIDKKFSGIFGLRRSGKTSVLHAVFRRLDRDGIKYITVQSESIQSVNNWKTALFDIAKDIRAKMSGIEKSASETDAEFETRLKLCHTEADYEKRATRCFVDDVHLYCLGSSPFVIAIDEVERITFNTTTASAWKSVEAFCGFWGALRDCGCVLIISGVNSMINEIGIVAYQGEQDNNPMYERITCISEATKTYLPPFTDEQTREMINTLGGYSRISFSQVFSDINRAFGGQPYAIRQFCAFLFEQNKHNRQLGEIFEITIPTFRKALFDFSKSMQGIALCKTMLERIRIFEDEYKILKELALSPEKRQIIPPENIAQIDHLEKYGLIIYDRATCCVTFCINIVKEYLVANVQKDPKDMTNDERRRFVQDYVAICEKKLKTFIRDYYVFNGKTIVGRKAIVNIVAPNRAYKPIMDATICDFSDLFDHRKFIMHFSSIRKVITGNWAELGKSFEACGISKAEFNLYMEALNAGRNDADHYDAENIDFSPDDWDISDTIMTAFYSAKTKVDNFLKIVH